MKPVDGAVVPGTICDDRLTKNDRLCYTRNRRNL